MTDYTPTTLEVANSWWENRCPSKDFDFDDVYGQQFERWLMRVKFEAWEEGYQQDIDDQYAHAAGDYVAHDANPYRAEEG